MLVLAVHTVSQVTAKVAFSTILLQDFVTSKKKLPAEFKCRILVPTSGSISTSLWDCNDPTSLLNWLNENINVDCKHEVFEVQEDFGVGLGEIQRSRAAERVTTGTKDVAERTAKAVGSVASATVSSVHDLDQRLKISEKTSYAIDAVRESTVVQSTASVLTKAGSSVKNATVKVWEQPAVASATEAVGSGFKKLGSSFSNITGKVTGRPTYDGGVAADAVPAGDVLRSASPPNPSPSPLGAGVAASTTPANPTAPQDKAFTLQAETP